MTVRKPLVSIGGVVQEIPVGDVTAQPDAAGATGEIQFTDSGGGLTTDPDFLWSDGCLFNARSTSNAEDSLIDLGGAFNQNTCRGIYQALSFNAATSAFGMHIAPSFTTAATTTFYGINIDTPTTPFSGSVATAYGVKIPALGGTAANYSFHSSQDSGSSNYAFYCSGTARSSFGTNGIVLQGYSGDPSTLSDGQIWYNSSTNKFRKRENGASSDIGASTTPLTTKGDLFAYSSSDGRFPVGADGTRLVANSGSTFGLQYERMATDPRYESWSQHDMNGTTTASTTGGTVGQTLYHNVGSSAPAPSDIYVAGRIGVKRLDTGTNAAGICRLAWIGGTAAAGNGSTFTPGGGNTVRVIFVMRVPTNPASGQDFQVIAAARDLYASASTDQVFVDHSFGLNSGNFRIVTAKAGASTTTNTSTAPPTANTWYELAIEFDTSASSVTVYLNGSAINAAVSSNVPIVSLHPTVMAFKVSGTTARQVDVDTIQIWSRYGTAIY